MCAAALSENSNVLLYSALHGLATTSRQLRGVGGLLRLARQALWEYFQPPLVLPRSCHRFSPIWSPAVSGRDRMLLEKKKGGVCVCVCACGVLLLAHRVLLLARNSATSAPPCLFPTTNATPGSAVKRFGDVSTSDEHLATVPCPQHHPPPPPPLWMSNNREMKLTWAERFMFLFFMPKVFLFPPRYHCYLHNCGDNRLSAALETWAVPSEDVHRKKNLNFDSMRNMIYFFFLLFNTVIKIHKYQS